MHAVDTNPTPMSLSEAQILEDQRLGVIIQQGHVYKLHDVKPASLATAADKCAKGNGKQQGWGSVHTMLSKAKVQQIQVTGVHKDRIKYIAGSGVCPHALACVTRCSNMLL